MSASVNQLAFAAPITHVYNPLEYAWAAHERYLRLHGNTHKKVIFLGMNPGPFGMAQTGVPFGEIELVRDWIGVDAVVGKPVLEHPKRRIEGFGCTRSEVSGRRLWGAFRDRFGSAEAFFADHFVVNYCPLVFMEASGKNRTPDKMPACEIGPLFTACNAHLREVVLTLQADWLVGVGAFAEGRAMEALKGIPIQIGRILHPSPASPLANRGWADLATRQLLDLKVW